MTIVDDMLERGGTIVLDGAMGTELQARGAVMDEDAWCARAMLEHPGIVRAIHADYIAAGADVVTANTFGSNRFTLEPAGLADRFDEINRAAVALALEARDATGREVAIAGSISTMPALAHMAERPKPAQAARDYRRLADLLAEEGCDLVVCEMMMAPGHAEAAVDAARATGLPVWVGISAHAENGRMATYPAPIQIEPGRSTRNPADLLADGYPDLDGFARGLLAGGAGAAGIMHSEIEDVAPGLEVLKSVWSGPLLAYAHSGRFAPPDWRFVDVVAPDAYAEAAAAWVADLGVRIVGGCCGLGPDHIRALAERVRRDAA